tara:strand:+ start:2371 stop:2565 length:195 start_codon:yes stop_codon:yes gene_type:complete
MSFSAAYHDATRQPKPCSLKSIPVRTKTNNDEADNDDPYVSSSDQKRNDAIERGDELRDRAKDE